MNKLIKRLIDCGMSRDVALFMSRKFRGRPHDFEIYVESIENQEREDLYV